MSAQTSIGSTENGDTSFTPSHLVRFGELGFSGFDPLENFNLTLDDFYGVLKERVGSLADNELVQLGTIAIPADIGESYPRFSLNNLVTIGDITVEQNPDSDYSVAYDTSLFKEYKEFVSTLARMIEKRILSASENAEIDRLTTKMNNELKQAEIYEKRRRTAWKLYAYNNNILEGDNLAFRDYISSHPLTSLINSLYDSGKQDVALINLIRLREYDSAEDKEVIDTWGRLTDGTSTIKLPIFEDSRYSEEERKKFSLSYFSSLGDSPSDLFDVRPVIAPTVTLDSLLKDTIGSVVYEFSKIRTKTINIVEEWNAKTSGSGNTGFLIRKPYSFSFNASGSTTVNEDFSSVLKIGFGVDMIQSVAFTRPWFKRGLFKHPKVISNIKQFDRFFGPKGSLVFTTSRAILARGFFVSFEKSESFKYDYKSALTMGGESTGSVKLLGVKFGGASASGSTTRTDTRQTFEQDGSKLTLRDGDNIRLMGFVVSYNAPTTAHFKRRREAVAEIENSIKNFMMPET
jgi:hypothetical protein